LKAFAVKLFRKQENIFSKHLNSPQKAEKEYNPFDINKKKILSFF